MSCVDSNGGDGGTAIAWDDVPLMRSLLNAKIVRFNVKLYVWCCYRWRKWKLIKFTIVFWCHPNKPTTTQWFIIITLHYLCARAASFTAVHFMMQYTLYIHDYNMSVISSCGLDKTTSTSHTHETHAYTHSLSLTTKTPCAQRNVTFCKVFDRLHHTSSRLLPLHRFTIIFICINNVADHIQF